MQPDEIHRVLGVAPDADAQTVKRAYRTLAQKYHPDLDPSDTYAEQKFMEASRAYAAWSATHEPADAAGTARSNAPPVNGVEDVFSAFQDLFSDFFGGGKGGMRGGDLAQPLRLSYLEARDGAKKTVEVTRRVRCEACKAAPGTACAKCKGTGQVQHTQGFFMVQTTCPDCKGGASLRSCGACEGGLVRKKGTLEVTVPPDVKAGMKLRVPDKGDEHPSGQPGHLFLEIVIDNTNVLVRDGDDVTFETEVPANRAMFGGKLEVATLDGPAMIDVPRFVRDGAMVTLAGRGHLRAATSGGDPYREVARGDQRVILRLSRKTQLRRRKQVSGIVMMAAAGVISLIWLL